MASWWMSSESQMAASLVSVDTLELTSNLFAFSHVANGLLATMLPTSLSRSSRLTCSSCDEPLTVYVNVAASFESVLPHPDTTNMTIAAATKKR